MNNIVLIISIMLLNFNNVFGQWTHINTIPSQDIIALKTYQNTIYAAGLSNTIFKSNDSGNTWMSITVTNNPIIIESMEIFDNVIYVGTNNTGIFQSTDNGLTWQNTIGNILEVSGFTKKNGIIYASTLGNGVYVFDSNTNSWLPFNNALPLGVAGVVSGIISSSDYLFIASGANGVFHKYDYTLNNWVEGYYYGQLIPGLIIDDLTNSNDTIIVVNGNSVIKSFNAGLTWSDDKIGTHNGIDRIIQEGSIDYYLLTNTLGNSSWIQKRNKFNPIGESWALNEELIPNIYSYDIIEYENKLFLATNNGLYQKSITLGIEIPNQVLINLQVVPNPSNSGEIKVKSAQKVERVSIINNLGQAIHSEKFDKENFTITHSLPNGLYFFEFYFSNGEHITKKIIVQ